MNKLPELTAENLPSVRKYLPDIFLQIEAMTSTQTALLLVNSEYRRMQCPIAKGMTKVGKKTNAALAALIGEKHTERLAVTYGEYRSFFVPRCIKARTILRNREILAEFDRITGQGMAVRKATRILAARYGITQRQIFHIAKTTAE